MRTWLTFDDIERLEARARKPAAHRQAAAQLTAWAEEQHPDDEVSPADLIAAAAWHLGRAGDTEAALERHRRAVAAEGTTTPDARCLLTAALLEAGQLDEARQVADGLRRSAPRVVDIASMAEVFELAGDLTQAHRWTAMGVTRLELASDSELPEDYEVDLLLSTHQRVREALGFPPDDLDL